MNVSINLTLDTRSPKSDGSCPIVLRMSRNHKNASISTGVCIHPQYWNNDKRQVRNTYKGVSSIERLNMQLQAELKNAKNVILELKENQQLDTLSLVDIKSKITGRGDADCFFNYADTVLTALKKAGRIGTWSSYKDAVKAFENYNGSRSLPFKQLTYEYLQGFETDHYSKGNNANGLGAYLRAIRAIYNKAKKAKIIDPKHYPFAEYKIGSEDTNKRAIDKTYIEKIIDLKLEPGNRLYDSRNYFVVSFMLYGMNFIDIAHLKPAHILNGRVDYQRNKTTKHFDIKVTDELQKILDHYIARKGKYIFPVITAEEDEVTTYFRIRNARKYYNEDLKEIAERCGIEKKLTSYVSRHSFATLARMSNVPIDAISAMLGHKSVKTTEVYLKGLPSHILDNYNENILKR